MMRHLVEVMLVTEGKQPWARALRDRRSQQGLPLPLPSVSSNNGDSDGMLHKLLRVTVEGAMNKELVRLIASFV